MTAASPDLVGGTSITESHISGLIDSIVVLRHVETRSRLQRGVLVLKMRGSDHDRSIRQFDVVDGRLEVGEPFSHAGGILIGQPLDRPSDS